MHKNAFQSLTISDNMVQKTHVCQPEESEFCINFQRKHDKMEMEICSGQPDSRGIAFSCPLGNMWERSIFMDLTAQHLALVIMMKWLQVHQHLMEQLFTSSASLFEEFSGIRGILAALSPEKLFPGSSVLEGLNQQGVIGLCLLELLKVSWLQRQSDLQLSYSL